MQKMIWGNDILLLPRTNCSKYNTNDYFEKKNLHLLQLTETFERTFKNLKFISPI